MKIAEELYMAYWHAVKGTDINGNSLPTWQQLCMDESRIKIKQAWEKVTEMALKILG